MASKINRSFLWGVCIASCTWLLSLYLYWRLTSTNLQVNYNLILN